MKDLPNDQLMENIKAIRVEYEIPPLRAIYLAKFLDEGQPDDDIRRAFLLREPKANIRKIERRQEKRRSNEQL